MTNRVFALILCFVMCMSLFPASAFAEEDIAEEAVEEAISLPQTEENDSGQPIAAFTDETEEVAPVGDGALDVPEDDAEIAESVILSDSEESLELANPSVGEADSSPCIGEPEETVILRSESDEESQLPAAEDEILRSAQDDMDDPFVAAEADEVQGIVASGRCGDNLTWTLDEEGILTISGTGEMTDYYTPTDAPWFDKRDTIKSVVISSGVTSVGDCAFCQYSSLTSVNIPTTVESIGNYAFMKCSSLESIELPDSVMSIGGCAFYNCTSLASITIPSGVKSIADRTFYSCTSLSSVKFPSGLLYIEHCAFQECSSLTNITIPSGVSTISEGAFYGCSSLASIEFPDSLKSIERDAFRSCSSLVNIELPTGLLTIGDDAFNCCTGLKCIIIPATVTSIGETAFLRCDILNEIWFLGAPPSFGESCFLWVEATMYYPGTVSGWTESVRKDYGGFLTWCVYGGFNIHFDANGGNDAPSDQTKICDQALTLSSSIPTREGYTFLGWSANASAELADYQPGESYTVEGDATLYAVWKLTNYTIRYDANGGDSAPATQTKLHGIPLTLSSQPATRNGYRFLGWATSSTASAAMYQPGDSYTTDSDAVLYAVWLAVSGTCGENLTWTLDDQGTLTISGIGEMYDYDFGPGGTYFPSWLDTGINVRSIVINSGVTSIGDYAFSDSGWLSSITLPESLLSISEGSFYWCSNLRSIVIPDSVTSIGALAFYGCSGLTSVDLPAGLTSMGNYSFSGCSSLSSIIIPSGVSRICRGTFSECSYLSDITIPSGVKIIESAAFSSCVCLESISLPETLERIDGGPPAGGAFQDCSSLTEIYFSDSVTSIGTDAFSSCSELRNVYFEGYEVQKDARVNSGWEVDGNDSLFNASWHFTPASPGWKEIEGKWYYFNANGTPKTGWVKSGSSWYYMNSNGVMQTGWVKVSSTWYYMKASGAMVTGWQKIGGTWYYFKSSGAMVTGWQKIGSTWYYFKSSGAMVTGWQKIGSTWYYFQGSGAMKTGWLKSGDSWYYLDNSGAMLANTSRNISGKVYYFNASGVCTNP